MISLIYLNYKKLLIYPLFFLVYPCFGTDITDSKILFNYTFIDNSNSNGWVNMQPQTGLFPLVHFGPEVSLAIKLKESGYNLPIFKFCKGASSLHGDWKSPGKNGYRDDMFLALKTSINDLIQKVCLVKIRCLIWIQEESHANSLTNATSFQKNLLNFITMFRNEFKQNTIIPVILGVDKKHPFVVKFPQDFFAQHNITKNDPTIVSTSTSRFSKAGSVHLTPERMVSHGEYIHKRFINLIEEI